MSRPSPYTGVLTNYNGEAPTMASHHHSVPQDTSWQAEFLRDRPHCYPTLVAYRGYVPWRPEQRHYYLAEDGWRDTETDAAWVFDVLKADGKVALANLDTALAGVDAALRKVA